MSEYRNTNDPMRRDTPYDLSSRDGMGSWGWAAGAVLVVILLALAFGIGHTPSQTGPTVAANNTPMNQQVPAPNGPASPAYTPAPSNSANPTPLSPAAPQSKP
jgi:hypothetical protein